MGRRAVGRGGRWMICWADLEEVSWCLRMGELN